MMPGRAVTAAVLLCWLLGAERSHGMSTSAPPPLPSSTSETTCFLTDETRCVTSCPAGKQRDGSVCTVLQQGCGLSCFECAEDGVSCARCTNDKVLESGLCVSSCMLKTASGRNDLAINTFNPISKVCRVEEQAEEEPLLSSTMIIVMACGGSILICCTVVLLYICCDRRHHRSAAISDSMAASQNIQMRPLAGASSVVLNLEGAATEESSADGGGRPLSSSSTSGPTAAEKEEWKATLRRVAKAPKPTEIVNLDDVSATTEMQIDATPTTQLEGEDAKRFFKRLRKMKKDQETYAAILQEMTRRQASKHNNPAARAKYDTLIADLTRLLRLFRQKKADREVPIDGHQLLDWAQSTLDRFNGHQSR